MAESYGNFTFNILRNHQTFPQKKHILGDTHFPELKKLTDRAWRPSPREPAGRRLELVCQRFHDKTRRKNTRIKSPRCRHPLLPACEEGSGGMRVGQA